jgi:hypothetical protein
MWFHITTMKKDITEKWADLMPQLGTFPESIAFPLITRVTTKTISMDLVSVSPLGNSSEEMERISSEIKTDNRDGKISSVLEGKEYVEKKVQDHPDYKGPTAKLHYLDYVYGSTPSNVKKV